MGAKVIVCVVVVAMVAGRERMAGASRASLTILRKKHLLVKRLLSKQVPAVYCLSNWFICVRNLYRVCPWHSPGIR